MGAGRDERVAVASQHQLLLVIPSLDLIAVRFGDALADPGEGSGFWRPVVEYVFQPLIAAMDFSENRKKRS